MANTLLKVSGLKVSYGGIKAVKGIDMEVREGELITLIGSNGAGRTTTMKAITGSLGIEAGSVVKGQTGTTLANPAVLIFQPGSRIEARGTQNFPELDGRKLYGDLTMLVTVDAEGRLLDAARIVVLRRQRMPVGDEKQAGIVVLELDPVFENPVVMTKMEGASGAHAGKNTFSVHSRSIKPKNSFNNPCRKDHQRIHDLAKNAGEEQQQQNRKTPAFKLGKSPCQLVR